MKQKPKINFPTVWTGVAIIAALLSVVVFGYVLQNTFNSKSNDAQLPLKSLLQSQNSKGLIEFVSDSTIQIITQDKTRIDYKLTNVTRYEQLKIGSLENVTLNSFVTIRGKLGEYTLTVHTDAKAPELNLALPDSKPNMKRVRQNGNVTKISSDTIEIQFQDSSTQTLPLNQIKTLFALKTISKKDLQNNQSVEIQYRENNGTKFAKTIRVLL